MRTAQGALLTLVAVVAVAAPRAAAAPDPYQIFGNARAYWHQQKYPALIDYEVAVDVVEGGNERVEHYASEYNAETNVVQVDPVSDYERAHPVYPKGINISIIVPLNKPLPPVDWLGVPYLAPTYSFGMAPFIPAPTPTPFNSAALVTEIRKEFHDPNPRATPSATPTPDAGLQEIATVYAHNRDYTITLLGTETIDGHPCYHLGLTPTRDPGQFRIRQAWIDEQTFATWQLQDALNFTSGPGTSVAWTIHFAQVDGAQYIREEDALGPMKRGGEIYTKASVWFENLLSANAPALPSEVMDSVGTPLQEPTAQKS